jgi:hypothetical protein
MRILRINLEINQGYTTMHVQPIIKGTTKSDYDIFRLSDSRLFGHDKDSTV